MYWDTNSGEAWEEKLAYNFAHPWHLLRIWSIFPIAIENVSSWIIIGGDVILCIYSTYQMVERYQVDVHSDESVLCSSKPRRDLLLLVVDTVYSESNYK